MAAAVEKIAAEIFLDESRAIAKYSAESVTKATAKEIGEETSMKMAKLAKTSEIAEENAALNLFSKAGEESSIIGKSLINSSTASVRNLEASEKCLSQNLNVQETLLLSSVDEKSAAILSSVKTERIACNEVMHVIEKTTAKDSNFEKFWNCLLNTARSSKTLIVGGVTVTGAYEACKWISSYIHEHNGPRLITKTFIGKELSNKRIRSPYPCGFRNKEGTVEHPLNAEILKWSKGDPCKDWEAYDACGGWATLLSTSRLSLIADKTLRNKMIMMKANNSTLACHTVTIGEAIAALCRELGKTTGSILRESCAGITEGLHVDGVMMKCVFALFTAISSAIFLSYIDKLNDVRILVVIIIVIFVVVMLLLKAI